MVTRLTKQRVMYLLNAFQGYKYSGVQYSRQCLCGNTFARYELKSEYECDYRCPGDSHVVCGGVWRNSIYSTGVCGEGYTMKGDDCVAGILS